MSVFPYQMQAVQKLSDFFMFIIQLFPPDIRFFPPPGGMTQPSIANPSTVIGHALWNYKEKDFGLVDERFREVRDDFIACL